MMKHCTVCGAALQMRFLHDEGKEIPFCPVCNDYRFEMFNVAVCVAIFTPKRDKVMMMRQYGREKYNFLGGYVNKEETAEEALVREMNEEMGMVPLCYAPMFSQYYAPSNTLMLAYYAEVADEDVSARKIDEVDEARWFTYTQAQEAVIKGAVAERLLQEVKNRFADLQRPF
ncbi:MAG: NUDIX domain-containing protein [Paludibacteraceae bacterium]|nr:NUDIX domain-containing protein [Paludibacteraceae bacterium]